MMLAGVHCAEYDEDQLIRESSAYSFLFLVVKGKHQQRLT